MGDVIKVIFSKGIAYRCDPKSPILKPIKRSKPPRRLNMAPALDAPIADVIPLRPFGVMPPLPQWAPDTVRHTENLSWQQWTSQPATPELPTPPKGA